MSKKSAKIAELIESCRGLGLDAHYLGYFLCFNQGLFYEAHDVLEELWLAQRGAENDAFYKGLIQLAGAFVHLQKHSLPRPRLKPAAALLRLARGNLSRYPATHEHLDLLRVLALIEHWLERLEAGAFEMNPLIGASLPQITVPLGTRNETA